jgi:hypothetical protein
VTVNVWSSYTFTVVPEWSGHTTNLCIGRCKIFRITPTPPPGTTFYVQVLTTPSGTGIAVDPGPGAYEYTLRGTPGVGNYTGGGTYEVRFIAEICGQVAGQYILTGQITTGVWTQRTGGHCTSNPPLPPPNTFSPPCQPGFASNTYDCMQGALDVPFWNPSTGGTSIHCYTCSCNNY